MRALDAMGSLVRAGVMPRAASHADAASRVHATANASRRLSGVGAPAPRSRRPFAAAAQASLSSQASPHAATSMPSLESVAWSKEQANSVQLIGNVGAVDVISLPSGQVKVNLRLAVNRPLMQGQTDRETDWFGVEVWDDLALQVSQHVPVGMRVAVTGRLAVDKWTDKVTGQPRNSTYVKATRIAAVERREAFGADAASAGAAARARAPPAAASAEPSGEKQAQTQAGWERLLYFPDEFFDSRADVGDSKRPDFRHKASGLALWLPEPHEKPNPRTPAWVSQYMGFRGEVPPRDWVPPAADALQDVPAPQPGDRSRF